MKTSNAGVVAIEGHVAVAVARRPGTTIVYQAAGLSRRGDLREALANMRLHAEYKYRAERQLSTGDTLATKVRDYKVVRRAQSGIVTKRYRRRGRYYFVSRDARTGRIVGGGRWSLREFDLDDEIDKTDTL